MALILQVVVADTNEDGKLWFSQEVHIPDYKDRPLPDDLLILAGKGLLYESDWSQVEFAIYRWWEFDAYPRSRAPLFHNSESLVEAVTVHDSRHHDDPELPGPEDD